MTVSRIGYGPELTLPNTDWSTCFSSKMTSTSYWPWLMLVTSMFVIDWSSGWRGGAISMATGSNEMPEPRSSLDVSDDAIEQR